MKTLIGLGLVVSALVTPALSFAQASNQPVTRAEYAPTSYASSRPVIAPPTARTPRTLRRFKPLKPKWPSKRARRCLTLPLLLLSKRLRWAR